MAGSEEKELAMKILLLLLGDRHSIQNITPSTAGDTPERKQWTNDQDSYFPATTTRVDDGGRLNSAEYHRYQRGGGNESPEHAREQHNGTGTVAARRMDNISGSLGEGATARSSGGKMWPPTRRAVFPFAAAATSTSQKKQS